jgi:hypothetical protein
MGNAKGQAGAVSISKIEALVSHDSSVLLAGECRLADIGEASPSYLAKEAFVAMVEVAIRQKKLFLAQPRHRIQRQKQTQQVL